MTKLADKACKACREGTPSLSKEEAEKLMSQLKGWKLEDGKRLKKSMSFDDFMKPMAVANQIATLAEEQDHHPDLTIKWGELGIELWTHKINGLSENDFILAAKIDQIA